MGELKIIGGLVKGKKIKSCKGLYVRPVLARIKKSLFDIIQHDLKDAECLDLFSGTGSIGLEAISRGAKYVIFVEKHPVAIQTIRHNINLLRFEQKSKLLSGDVFVITKDIKRKFDIIFLDPPFPTLDIEELLTYISNVDLLKRSGTIILHHPLHKLSMEKIEKLMCIRKIKYGQNLLSFYKLIEFIS